MNLHAAAPNDCAPFQPMPSGRILENILMERLPHSAILCNMMKYEDIPNCDMNISWFTLNGKVCPDSWIIATFWREENYNEYIISPPSLDSFEDDQLLEFKNGVTKSKIFKWKDEFMFTAAHPELVPLLKEVIKDILKTEARSRRRYQFFMNAEEATRIETRNFSEKVDGAFLKTLDIPAGAKFITDGWEHAGAKTYEFSAKQISRLPSAGMYINDEPVAGVLLKRHGSLGMLYTKPEFRNKGFASMVMKSVMKEMGQLGLNPCSYVDTTNDVSKAFHQKLGFQLTSVAEFVFL